MKVFLPGFAFFFLYVPGFWQFLPGLGGKDWELCLYLKFWNSIGFTLLLALHPFLVLVIISKWKYIAYSKGNGYFLLEINWKKKFFSPLGSFRVGPSKSSGRVGSDFFDPCTGLIYSPTVKIHSHFSFDSSQ
jgi:hypothetical protein